jgi:hypothetical protein
VQGQGVQDAAVVPAVVTATDVADAASLQLDEQQAAVDKSVPQFDEVPANEGVESDGDAQGSKTRPIESVESDSDVEGSKMQRIDSVESESDAEGSLTSSIENVESDGDAEDLIRASSDEDEPHDVAVNERRLPAPVLPIELWQRIAMGARGDARRLTALSLTNRGAHAGAALEMQLLGLTRQFPQIRNAPDPFAQLQALAPDPFAQLQALAQGVPRPNTVMDLELPERTHALRELMFTALADQGEDYRFDGLDHVQHLVSLLPAANQARIFEDVTAATAEAGIQDALLGDLDAQGLPTAGTILSLPQRLQVNVLENLYANIPNQASPFHLEILRSIRDATQRLDEGIGSNLKQRLANDARLT